MFDVRANREAPGLLASAWRYRWTTLALILLTGWLGFVSTAVLPGTPSVTASMSLADPHSTSLLRTSGGASGDLRRYTANRAEFARSNRVLAATSSLLKGRYTPEQLATKVKTSVSTSADVIVVTATAPTSKDAADIANAVTTAYSNISAADTKAAAATVLKVINDQAVRIGRVIAAQGTVATPSTSVAVQTLVGLQSRANEVSTYAAAFGSGVVYVEPAKAAPETASGRSSKRNLVIGALVGFLLALAIAWIRADRNRRIDDPEDAADLLAVPLLGDIPDLHRREREKLTDLTTMPAEPYQFATTGLRRGLPAGVLLVVSADRHDGRTTTAANVAAGAAREGMRVALVDGDSRTQGLGRLIGVDADSTGLTDVVAGRADLESSVIPVRVGEDTLLSVLPAGRFHDGVPSDFRSRQMAGTLASLRASHDLVIIDCPPLLRAPDAAALAGHADGVLAVVRAGSAVTRVQALRQQLELLPARLLGYVVTRPRRRPRDVVLRLAPTTDGVESIPSAR